VIDENSLLCLAIRVGRRCMARDVVTVLKELTSVYPRRHSSGPIAGPNSSLKLCGAGARLATPPPRPTSSEDPRERTPFNESFNGSFLDEFLSTELSTTAPSAQILVDRWRWKDNTLRPHSAFQGHNHPLT
jgi:hypothetical protein